MVVRRICAAVAVVLAGPRFWAQAAAQAGLLARELALAGLSPMVLAELAALGLEPVPLVLLVYLKPVGP